MVDALIISILVIILLFVISALPLYLAVKVLGGKTNIIKTILVMIVAGILTAIITAIFPFGGIIAFILLIWIYHEMFRLKWIKALIAWVLQLIFIFLLGALFVILGVGSLASMFVL
jgi:hypothetical protein